MDPNITIAVIGGVILLGVFLADFSRKTGWPLELLLLLLGLLVGPILHLVNTADFQGAIHSFAILVLIIVLFDTGYEIKLSKIKKEIVESVDLTLVGVISTLIIVFLIAKYMLGFNTYLSILFGALLASTDLTIISPLMKQIKLKQRIKDELDLEATLNSVFAAVIAIVVGTMIVYSDFAEALGKGFFFYVFTGVAIGLLLGWVLLKGLHHLKFEDMPAIVTIGAVLLVYAIAELIGASGVIAALIVGLLYGNIKPAPPKFVMLFGERLQTILIAFVYIMLGAMITFDAFVNYAKIVAVIVTALIVSRYFLVKFVTMKDSLLAQRVIGISGPRGIITAILIISYAYLFPNPDLIISLGFAVILCTSLVVFILPLIEKKTNPRIKKAGLRL